MASGVTLFGRPGGAVDTRFRENRKWTPRATAHGRNSNRLVVDDYIVALTTDKNMSEPAGRWSLTLKDSVIGSNGSQKVDWQDAIASNDWVELHADQDHGRRRTLMIGPVDSVQRSRAAGPAGAQVRTYTVSGRDMGKPLAITDLTDMRAINTSRIQAQVSAPGAANEMARQGRLTPDAVVAFLMQYVMAGGDYRSPSADCWKIPSTLPIRGTSGAKRQLTDILSTEWITAALEGELAATGSFASNLPGGGKCWDLMSQYGNMALNEMFVDLRPAYASRLAPDADADTPSLVLREKPFPILPGSAPWRTGGYASVAWSGLPVTAIHAFDLEQESVTRSDAELVNYWSFLSGGVEMAYRDVVAEATFRSSGDVLNEGSPRLHRRSIEDNGMRRMEQQSLYVDPAAVAGLRAGAVNGWQLYTGWTGIIRDWYALNARFLSGTLSMAYAEPGIRVGERLQLWAPGNVIDEFYVEGVGQSFRRGPDGATKGATRLSVTRGLRLHGGTYADAYAAEMAQVLAG